jgi:hypothetical protein
MGLRAVQTGPRECSRKSGGTRFTREGNTEPDMLHSGLQTRAVVSSPT